MPEKLGQNFLKDESVVQRIIEESDLKKDDVVLEVGPGKGILTEELAKRSGKVLAIEIDNSLLERLRNQLRTYKNVEIINEDILKINFQELITRYGLLITDYKVIANIPYYITSKIIRLFLENEFAPKEMILMVQKEVAERIVAEPGKMSILAVSVQYYASAKILFEVSKEAFDPTPEVDSAVIKVESRKKKVESKKDAEKFFRIVKAGFCARRKTLSNNLSNSLHISKKEAEEKLSKLGFLPTVRAQELSVDDWKKLEKTF
ncbi:MAG: hypothetical protein ACD_11C00054G0012 [uncultured bacterium]|nr:MAG: hypothetical protein ACD_11C00054G0012 [uncultured bacterium]